MAEALTPVKPEQVVTSEAPTSHLSGAEIAQPYALLGHALDKAGESLESVAVPLAERAGSQAVTRDAEGNIQVEHMPMLGLAGQAYGRAMKMAALAEADGNAKRADIELRQQFHDNPQGYLVAADAARKKTIADLTAAAGPEVGLAAGRAVDATTTQTYRGLLNEKERLDLQKADGAITAGVNSASDDAMALARQGVALDAPEMQSLLGKYTTLLDEKLKNPRLAYTPEQHDLDLQQFQGQLAGARNIYHVDQVYKKDGYQAAVEAAKDVLTNPDYKLTPAQRQGFFSHAMGEVRANEAIRHQDIGEARTAFRELSTASSLGQKITPDEVESLRQAFRSANYPAGVAAVDAAFAHKDLHDNFGRLPLGQQAQELNTIQGAAAAKSAYGFFTGKGYTPEQASGIVGNLIHESGLNPTAMGDSGTSGGLAQFHNERLTALKQYAASVGKPAGDFQTQLEFIDKELHGSEAPTLARLQGARTPEEAAKAFIHYERPQGYTPDNPAGGLGFENRQKLARTVFQGSAADGSGGPGVASWLIANRTASVDDAAVKSWKTVMADWSAGKGGPPSADRVNEIVDAARATNNVDLLAKIARDADVIDKVQWISQLPVSQQVQTEVELRRRQANGSTDPGAEMIEKQLTARTQAIQKGLQDDPIATAVANFPDKLKTPPPLDFSDPAKLVAGLKMRGQIAQVAQANWQTGALPAMDTQDIVQAKAALANPDPSVKGGIYGAISQLPEETRNATLRKLAGNEPAGMVEAAAGSMMHDAPEIAASIFRGQSAIATNKKFLPSEGAEMAAYNQELEKHIPASTYSLPARTDPLGVYATGQGLVKARYAFLSAQADGDTSGKFNPDRLARAVDDVTGGILDHNGGKLIAPARGMPQSSFDRVMYGIQDSDLAGVTTQNGEKVDANYLRNNATLESVGDGRYFVKLGKDPLKPVYAYNYAQTDTPQKFMLDLRNRPMGVVPPPTPSVLP